MYELTLPKMLSPFDSPLKITFVGDMATIKKIKYLLYLVTPYDNFTLLSLWCDIIYEQSLNLLLSPQTNNGPPVIKLM